MNNKKLLLTALLSFLLGSCKSSLIITSTSSSSNNDSSENSTSTSSDSTITSSSESSTSSTDSSTSSSSSSTSSQVDESSLPIVLENKNEELYYNDSWNQTFAGANNAQVITNYNVQTKDLRVSSGYLYDPTTVGDLDILVIPVTFGSSSSLDEEEKELVRKDIAYTFFGQSSETGWESVSSYYYKSSYGKLNISGVVAPWYEIDKTARQFEKISPEPSIYALNNAVEWYKNNFDDISRFDKDNDKVIDAVWLIYDLPYNYSTSDVWWAYTYWNFNNDNVGNGKDYLAYTYAWASYDFLYEGRYGGIGSLKGDAHTYIHETGHILGLDDYYDYDSRQSPAGVLDMMDGNIGDHNSYSKMTLGWTNPIYVNGSTSISLRPFEEYGDFILLKDDWNNSPYDEYLLIEYYTPTGLNKKDSTSAYYGRPKLFTENGIKIYHIDSRIGKYSYDSYSGYGYFEEYVDTVYETNSYYSQIAHSNTQSYSANRNYRLLHLLDATGADSLLKSSSAYATNYSLFTDGITFDPTSSVYKNLFNVASKFNDGTSLNYKIEVVSTSADECELVITKI